jgi:hypothetical protein
MKLPDWIVTLPGCVKGNAKITAAHRQTSIVFSVNMTIAAALIF